MRLTTIRDAAFGRNPEFPEYAGLAGFYAERAAQYGVQVDADAPLPGNRNSYSYLSTQMLAMLPQSPDLVVVAHAVPDCGVETSIAGSVQRFLTGQPMVFAVTEQGRTTGFAAMRVAEALGRTRYRRVAVLALDQGTVPYPDPGLAGLDIATDHAVGLLFTADEPGCELTAMRHLTGVGAAEAGAVAAAELVKLASRDPDRELVFVLGEGLLVLGEDGLLADGLLTNELTATHGADERSGRRPRIRQAPYGRRCTGVWSELACELDTPSPARRTVIVAEYEPGLRCLGLLSFDVPPSWGVL